MGDPITERAHYLTVGGDGNEDLFLIQQGRVEHLGFVRVAWRRLQTESRDTGPPEGRTPGGLRRLIASLLLLAITV
jgi:hypothetical protein